MLDILRSLRSLLKISRVHTDGNIFRLHYSLTVIILMAFCIIITTKQYVGEPIDCLRTDGVDKSIINTYCWIHTTYSIPRAFNKKVGVDVPHPGVDNTNDPSEFQHHKYYQWVCFVLFVQAAAFYVPRYLWKLWESGKVEAVVMHLDVGVGFEPDLTLKKQAIVDYLYQSSGHHDWYAARYYLCEVLSFVNVVAQMFLLDAFFEGEFMRYGLNVLEFTQLDQDSRLDPMIKIFPRVTKCKFYKYGPSANIETIDALCLLPLNIINEKIYIFLWFWFVFLAILTFLMLMFGLIIIACPSVRVYMLNLRFRISQLNHLYIIVRKSTIGDWFLLYLLGKNMDSYILKDIVAELAQRYATKGKDVDQRMLI